MTKTDNVALWHVEIEYVKRAARNEKRVCRKKIASFTHETEAVGKSRQRFIDDRRLYRRQFSLMKTTINAIRRGARRVNDWISPLFSQIRRSFRSCRSFGNFKITSTFLNGTQIDIYDIVKSSNFYSSLPQAVEWTPCRVSLSLVKFGVDESSSVKTSRVYRMTRTPADSRRLDSVSSIGAMTDAATRRKRRTVVERSRTP